MMESNGRVAAVTGAASGLGRAMALAFAREGMHVALADVDEAMMKKAVASGKVSAEQVAGRVVAAVKTGRVRILTHPRILPAVKARVDDVLEDRAPRNPLAL